MKSPAAAPPASVSRETADRLDRFLTLVLAWNRTINLVARRDEPDLRTRHLDDCLNLLPYLPGNFDRAIDLGSGGGFPGLVLAIATNRHFDLVESDVRKAAFLREAIRVTAAPATVHCIRIDRAQLAPAPLITARALAPLTTLIAYASPFLRPDTQCLFPKGRTAQQELTQAQQQWHMRVEQWPNPLDPGASILRLSGITRV